MMIEPQRPGSASPTGLALHHSGEEISVTNNEAAVKHEIIAWLLLLGLFLATVGLVVWLP